jgi:uroporphyrinogen-III synthase
MSAAPLAGRGIVITRPREQAGGLAALVTAAGGNALLFPAIEIVDAPDLAPLAALLDRLEEFDLAVFISPSAVQKSLNLLHRRRGDAPWPAKLRVAAVGRGSRRELERHGLRDVIAPVAHADSEALLAMPELQDMGGRRVIVFRGEGGRELLGDTFTARGAEVVYAECYRRVRPGDDPGPLLKAWARGGVHAVTVSSAGGLASFFDMLGKLGQGWLRATPVFVSHERVAAEAARLGITKVRVAGPADEEMHAALVAYFAAAQ